MAILATSRKWLVTSRCAASRSPCSRQRFASMNSSCGSSIGNRLISSRYRVRPVSPDKMGKAAVWAISAPSLIHAPAGAAGDWAVAPRAGGAKFRYLAPATYTVESGERKGGSINSARRYLDFGQVAVKSREIGKSLLIAG